VPVGRVSVGGALRLGPGLKLGSRLCLCVEPGPGQGWPRLYAHLWCFRCRKYGVLAIFQGVGERRCEGKLPPVIAIIQSTVSKLFLTSLHTLFPVLMHTASKLPIQ